MVICMDFDLIEAKSKTLDQYHCSSDFRYLYISITIDVNVYYVWNLIGSLNKEWYRCGGEQPGTDAECHLGCL